MSDVETAQTGAPVEPTQDQPKVEPAKVEGSEATTEQTDEQTQEDRPRDEKGRFQQRVNEITRARRDAERERDHWRQQAEMLQQAQRQPQRSPEGIPKIEDYTDFNEYAADHARWVEQQAYQRVASEYQQQQAYARQADIASQFDRRAATYEAENPGFSERMATFASTFMPPVEVVEAIGVSEHGPAVFDYLAQHMDEADRIFRMPPAAAMLQIGRLEERISQPKNKPVSKAPAPAPVLGGGATPQKPPERMTDDEWYASQRAARARK